VWGDSVLVRGEYLFHTQRVKAGRTVQPTTTTPTTLKASPNKIRR